MADEVGRKPQPGSEPKLPEWIHGVGARLRSESLAGTKWKDSPLERSLTANLKRSKIYRQ